MTLFQLILLAGALYFAYQVYNYVNTMEDKPLPSQEAKEQEEAQPRISVEELVEKADDAYRSGDLQETKKYLREALYLEPKNLDILNKLGYVESQEGNYDEAISYAKDALEIEPDAPEVHAAIASFYRHEKEYDKAKEHYEKAIALEGNNEIYYFNYGNLLLDMNDTEGAKKMYEKAIEIAPDFMQAKFELEKLKKG